MLFIYDDGAVNVITFDLTTCPADVVETLAW